jgi:putative spermidine/putrescine transport system permease protein
MVMAVLPLLAGIGYALLYSFGIIGILNNGFTTQHWQAIFSDATIIFTFLYTIALSIASMCLSVFGGLFLALYLGKKLTKGFAAYAIYLPMAFPTMVAAFFFFQLLSNAGFVSRICFSIGLTNSLAGFPDLVNDKLGIGIILTQLFLSLPVFVLLYLSLIVNENIHQLQLLAASLGATKRQVLWRVTVPVLFKKSVSTIVIFFIFKLGSYEIPLLLGKSNPEVMSVFIARKMQRFNLMDIPQGYAVAVMYALLVFALLLINLKLTKPTANV